MNPKPPERLTTIYYFDFHRDLQQVYFTGQTEASVGSNPVCSIRLPSPSLFRGVLRLQDTSLKLYDSTVEFAQGAPPKHIHALDQSPYRFETPGLLITVRQSLSPFETLIDELIEAFSFRECPPEQLTQEVERWVPPELRSIWSLQTICEALGRHRQGYGEIETLMQNAAVTEILINGTESVYYEKQGAFYRLSHPMTQLRLERLMTKLLQKSGKTVNVKRPMVDFQLPTGERVNIILPPVSKKGP